MNKNSHLMLYLLAYQIIYDLKAKLEYKPPQIK